jgi:hypothetical protein
MNDDLKAALARSLVPLVKRMRQDVTARKGSNGSYWTDERITPALLEHHVNGGPARGLSPIKEGQSVTMVACLDFDSHKGEVPWDQMAERAALVADRLAHQGLRVTPFRSSGGNGIHLIMLWDEPQDAYSVRALLGEVLGACGLKDGAGGLIQGQVEVFPRQDSVGQGEYGNQFILPLAGRSVPLDLVFGLEPQSKDAALGLEWPSSDPVPLRQRPVRQVSASEPPEPLDKVRAALFAIPNDPLLGAPDYFGWRDLCFAVHEATGGSEDGWELFSAWSSQNPLHDEKFARKRVWEKVRDADERTSSAITRSTLFGRAKSFGFTWGGVGTADGFEDVTDEEIAQAKKHAGQHEIVVAESHQRAAFEAKERWKKAIQECPDELTLRDTVCLGIGRDPALSGVERDMLAEVLKGKLQTLGSKASVSACRKMLAPPKRTETKKQVSWTDGWVYVTDEDCFYRLDSDELLTMQSFNAKHNRFLPPTEDGEFRKSASWVALEEAQVPTVTRRVYLPSAGNLFTLDGVECANRFRASSMPATATHYTKGGIEARKLVLRHVDIITGTRKDVSEVLLSWLAYNVQNPGCKVRWAPLIKGVEGDGKSLFGRLLSAVLGTANVKDISPKVLGTDFTDWAHGACVGVLEEIKLTGHNRYDILNALKPYVTNNMVAIHPKGRAEFNVLNTMNYIAFTNHADALPIGDTDRRWFIVFTPFLSISDLEAIVGDRGAYFDSLYDAIETHREELRKWLLEYPISDSFKPNGSAPVTEEKGTMVAMSVSDDQDIVSSIIEAGGVGISARVVSTKKLNAAIRALGLGEPLQSSTLARELLKLGWIKVAKQIKWLGEPHRVWVRGISASDMAAVRAALDETSVTSVGNGSDVTEDFDLFA